LIMCPLYRQDMKNIFLPKMEKINQP
ncbi:hypothetical protein BAE44_0014247, partial [Dichanthelium oligosanthes]